MFGLVEIIITLFVRLVRAALRNGRSLAALAIGAGSGVAFGLSLAKFSPLPKGVMLMFVVMGVAIVAPAIIGFLNLLFPRQ